MGAFFSAVHTNRAQEKESKRQRRFEAAQIQGERDREDELKKKKQEQGRASLVKTTPRGVLGNQNSGRKSLTA